MTTRSAGDAVRFRPWPSFSKPDAWRDVDVAVCNWVRSHGGSEAVAFVAGWASYADGQGHSALPVDMTLPGGSRCLSEEQVTAARDPNWVADLSAKSELGAQPLVFDGDRIYLRRNYLRETAVAAMIVQLRQGSVRPRRPVSPEDLRVLFGHEPTPVEGPQARAVAAAPGRRFMVLTGGPGTGKTTTVLRMLLALSRELHARTGSLPRIRVSAPTGKAAQRLSESLRSGGDLLRSSNDGLPDGWRAHLENVLQSPSGTIHRLLGSRGALGGFRHNAQDPLAADVVVIDEASMLDLGLLKDVLSALSPTAVLILVGDADQLTSVGTGSVLMDIVAALEEEGSEDLIRLTHCFRADALLVPINESVRRGEKHSFDLACEASHSERRFELHEVTDRAKLRTCLARWTKRLKSTLSDLAIERPTSEGDQEGIMAALEALKRQQILCALREGPFGAVEVDQWITGQLRSWERLQPWAGQAWFPGRAVMITRNDLASGLFNGDVGLCLLVEHARGVRLQVAFEGDDQAGTRIRLFEPNTLPPHEGAFALTIHKSQGSEYGRVAVLLPPKPESPILTRQLLYTALSRAKSSIELWSLRTSVDTCISVALSRFGGLGKRLA